MYRGLLMVVFAAGFFTGLSQNLVNNPGFEDHIRCPNNFSTQSKDFNLPGWASVNLGTPDYFHQCSWGDCDVPFNWAGESNPHGGSAYVGIYVWNRPTSKPRSYREYVQGELKEPLKPGRRYNIEFYFKLASYSVYSVDRIGLLLTDSSFNIKDDLVINRKPTLSVIHQEPFSKNSWELAQMTYTAHGGEKFITIGNFFDNLTTQFTSLDNRKGKSPMLSGSAYIYLDDVSVSAIDPDPVPEVAPKPLVWSDGREIKPEETYILKNIQFEFDKYELLPVSFPELDRIVRIMNDKPDWHAELSGHTDDVGSEEYNLELSRNRATRVVEYLKSKGIAANRLGQHGYGKQRPLVEGRDDASRFINRRVEIRFLK
ncbi:MAG: OmpA family protein [Cyclobacteriaceae bacterium]|jgi:outer membrane protein OmpA-like peptidoglycan-associated protein|nr:OmpA family protein [Cyclobacteriaceae bacterium]